MSVWVLNTATMRVLTAVVIILNSVNFISRARRTFHGDRVFRVHGATPDLSDFGNQIDVWSDAPGGPNDLHVTAAAIPEFEKLLNKLEVNYEVFVEDLEALVDETLPIERIELTDFSLSDFNYSSYHTYEEIQAWVHAIAEEYPDLVHVQKLGESFEGREMNGLIISANHQTQTGFYMQSTIHAREWITPAATMKIIATLLENYNAGKKQERDILHRMNWYYLPIANVDGYAYTWDEDRMWRKTRTHHRQDQDCMGVDANRNFNTTIWIGEGSSDDPCSNLYRGPAPWSEPCVQNVRQWFHHIKNSGVKIKAAFDVHSYSQFWLYPYGYKNEEPANIVRQATIGRIAKDVIYDQYGTEFTVGTWYDVLYPSTGTAIDYWLDAEHVACSVTTELRDTGRYGFVLPERFILPVAEEMYGGYMTMAHAVMEGYCDGH